MNFIKIFSTYFILSILGLFHTVHAQNKVSFEKAESFYPNAKVFENDSLVWGYLSVPEHWEALKSDTVKIAVTVLKNRSLKANAPAVVFLQGGPGASGIQNIWSWRLHPIRQTHDVVLFDIRGTGFSKPRLCPDLGRDFLEILAKNQSEEKDEKQKVDAALSCKQELIRKGIDINAYHSGAVANDLHALKMNLGYEQWTVYGVSYGTYMTQVYASIYPEDISSLVLDSSIYDVSAYYTENTSNYMSSLKKVFNDCKNDPECNAAYPNLEETYFEVIAQMEENPIEVRVAKDFIDSESFTFNSEDFKIAIQQALYNKQLVEVIPLLIYQFKERNENVLSNLVVAFSSLLSMDYGVYYCVSCNETLPNNNFDTYKKNAAAFKKLNGGLSFYKTDFKVCDAWNLNEPDSLLKSFDISALKEKSFPVLVLSGEFDPITPSTNGNKTVENFKNAYHVPGYTYGHVPGFTFVGKKTATSFIKNPSQKPAEGAFKNVPEMKIVRNIKINKGVSKMGNSLSEMNMIFLAPLVISVGLMLFFIFVYLFKIVKKRYKGKINYLIRSLLIIASVLGLISLAGLIHTILNVSTTNYYILAFGLPQDDAYLFTLCLAFVLITAVNLLLFLGGVKKITNRSVVFALIFSNIIVGTYMLYWGIL